MPTVRLVQIPKPQGSRELLERPAGAAADLGPYMLGAGDIYLVCGKCESVLADRIEALGPVSDVVFRCQACGAYGETPV